MIPLTPFISQEKAPGDLQDAVVELYTLDSALNANIPASLRRPMIRLLRVVNSFYSNKIEGNPTHPAEILHAQEGAGASDPSDDLLEIKQHVEVQARLENLDIDRDKVCTGSFFRRSHKEFYEGLPKKFLEIKNPDNDELIPITPGEFRARSVKVGKHVPPEHQEIPQYMDWFEKIFNPAHIHGTNRLLAAAAAHHRFMWIHPFLDGNGRVGRLFTDNYMHCSGLGGYGLWSMSRGFGRDTEAYYQALSRADMVRQGTTDGRGILSDKGLLQFTEYFFDIALDQVKYFSALLEPRKLDERINYYFEMRNRGALVSSTGETLKPLKPESKDLYFKLLRDGPQHRIDLQGAINTSERTLRTIVSQMSDAGLVSAPAKKPVELELSPSSIEMLFPHLW